VPVLYRIDQIVDWLSVHYGSTSRKWEKVRQVVRKITMYPFTMLWQHLVHGSLARAGKVKSQTPKVEKQEKKKTPKGRAKKRMLYNRRFVVIVRAFLLELNESPQIRQCHNTTWWQAENVRPFCSVYPLVYYRACFSGARATSPI
jgi:small subunit ribosomal protein S30e